MAEQSPSAARRERLRGRLAELDVEAALITSLVNVRYLTGFTGSNAAVLVRADGPDLFCTDGRYRTQSATQVPDLEHVIERKCAKALTERAATDGIGALGFESHVVTVDGLDELRAAAPSARPVSLHAAVEVLRAVKDEDEIALLRRACAIADQALGTLIEHGGIRAGRTEIEVGRELDGLMLAGGAEERSFETIVASGPNSAIPHHRPTDRSLQQGDFVKIDFGALYAGYHSDMTRTMVLGPPADWQREVYDLVAEAQRRGCAALAVGADVRAVDAAAREHIAAAGYGEQFGHGLGHGVGLEIHEAPTVSHLGSGTLAAAMPVTVEPGVYLEGRGGVRIEDILVVRDDAAELLTMTTKDLLVL